MIGGVPGGRSTHGTCYGVLSWLIEEGTVDHVDVARLAVALVCRYNDDEPGSPWTIVLHVDEQGDERQRTALADVFLGHLGGERVGALPWVRKARHLIDIRVSPIELTPAGEGHALRIGNAARVRATTAVRTEQTVACVIPGYDRLGRELYADELTVDDDPFAWDLAGNCAFATDFEYVSERPR